MNKANRYLCLIALLGFCLGTGLSAHAANPDGPLRIEVLTAYNFIVDSNVESPSTYAPRSAFIAARIWNDGGTDLTDVYAYVGDFTGSTPGVYPSRAHPPLVGPLPGDEFALTHEGSSSGTADATRYLGAIPAGGYVPVYWLVSYPNLDENGDSVTGGIKPDDDLYLFYDIWVQGDDGGTPREAQVNRRVTMRNCISAMANKIFPNTANKVPQEYQDLLQKYEPEWIYTPDDGSAGTKIISEGIWYDLGNVSQGFDNDGDLVPDQNAWLQPVGDPEIFDSSAFRLAKTYVMLIVKLKEGGELVIEAVDQLYFSNLPDNTGVVGIVRYDFLVLQSGAAAQLTPYQMAASGFDNEKFNGDYGETIGLSSPSSLLAIDKTGDATASPGGQIDYSIAFSNGSEVAVGDPSEGDPLVIQDQIPSGTVYVAFSAATGNTLPAGVSSYTVLFSTDTGATWTSSTEPSPASLVTNIQWWLSDALEIDADGVVTFSVTVDNPADGPVVINTAGLSFGNTASFLEDTAATLILGNNQLGDLAFQDDGAFQLYGNGVQDAGEDGIPDVTVSLYYDSDDDGAVDAGDLLIGTDVTDANGGYLFSNLFDGNYLAVVDGEDPNLPAGYSSTTPLVQAADLDADRIDSNPVVDLDADFGFAPALTVDKSLIGSSPIYEGQEFSYYITVANNFPGFGDGEGGTLTYYYHASARDTAKDSGTGWGNQSNALGAPDAAWAVLTVGTNLDKMGVKSFGSGGVGTITTSEILVPLRSVNPSSKPFNFYVNLWFPGAPAGIEVASFTEASLPDGFDDYIAIDVTGQAATWTWETVAGSTIQLAGQKRTGTGGNQIYVDSAGFRLTTDITYPPATDSTILDPVPLQDIYDASLMSYVSADPEPDSVSFAGGTGTIDWDNIGPIYPGGSSAVTVYFTAQEPPGNNFTTMTNAAAVEWATFSNGVPANTGYDEVTVDLDPTGSIGDFVWRDLDADGVQDGGNETGIEGVTVELTPPAGVDLGAGPGQPVTMVTDGDGGYLFSDWLSSTGDYTVAVLTATLPGGSGTNTYDEDDGTVSPDNQAVVSLGSDGDGPEDHLTADFGYKDLLSLIAGTLWDDANRDGAASPGDDEPPLANVTIELYDGTMTLIDSTTTAADGTFSFLSDFNGDYTVQVVTGTGDMASGTWTASYDSDGLGTLHEVSCTVPLGGLGTADFSYYQTGDYDIGDTVFYDWNGDGDQDANEEGIAGIIVDLYQDIDSDGVYDTGVDPSGGEDTTDSAGNYLFENLPPGDYIVIVDHNSSGFPPLYYITADPQGAADGRSAVTISDADNLAQDFGYQPYGSGAIGDTVWRDRNADGTQSGLQETGISSVTVTLLVDFNDDDTYVTLTTTATDSDGGYLFDDLPDGSYRASVDTADSDLPEDAFGNPWYPTTAVSYDIAISDGNTDLTADFGFAALGALGDTIFWDANQNGTQDGNEGGVEGATVNLYTDEDEDGFLSAGDVLFNTATTNSDGNYLFTELPPDVYVVVVPDTGVLAGVELSADPDADGLPCSDEEAVGCDGEKGVTLSAGQNFMGADFGYVPSDASLGGTVWLDFDDDGTVDDEEVRIPYVTVELWSAGTSVDSTDTDPDGQYLFYGLGDDTYYVLVRTDLDFPTGLTQTYDPDGVLDDQAQEIVVSGGTVVTIGGNPWSAGDLAINFGYRYDGDNTLSGTIGLDGDTPDGVLGSGTSGVNGDEVAFEGVTVHVSFWDDSDTDDTVDPGEAVLLGSTVTDSIGDYSFTDLPEGAAGYYYIVSMVPPLAGLSLTTTTDDTPATILVETVDPQGYSTGVYQAVPIAQDITDMDFAFVSAADYDFGDLPEAYGTLLPYGARHGVEVVPDLYLGAAVTTEKNGQPAAAADTDGADDGVIAIGQWQEGTGGGGEVKVTVGAGSGWLTAFIDFNNNSAVTGSGEMIVSQAVSSTGGPGSDGAYYFTVAVPEETLSATATTFLYSRFRLLPSEPWFPSLSFKGEAGNGEVEDYRWAFNVISGTVYVDTDLDNVFSGGDTIQAGVIVLLYDAENNLIASTVSNDEGDYTFTGLPDDDYKIDMTVPVGAAAITDADGTGNGPDLIERTLLGASWFDQDFLLDTAASLADISGTVYVDTDDDNVFSAGDTPQPGVQVFLYRDINDDAVATSNELVTSTVTDGAGGYIFADLPDGDYLAVMITPAGAVSITDIDGNGNGSDLIQVTLTGTNVSGRDFLIDGDTLLGDFVWVDENKNGLQDAGESGIAGVTVELYLSDDTFVAATDTDSSGFYAFSDIPPGDYYVEFSNLPDGYYFTSRDRGGNDALDSDADQATGKTIDIALLPGETDYNWDAGLYTTGTQCFDVHRATLASAQTDSTTLADTGLEATFNMTTTGAAAVFSSFGTQTVGGELTGSWDLRMDDTWSSQTLQWYVPASGNRGLAGAIHVFAGLSSGLHTARLRQATDAGANPVMTRDADLVVLPLTSADGNVVLNYGLDTLGPAGETTTFSALTDVSGLSTNVTNDIAGRLFAAAVLNSESAAGGAKTGTFDLQINGVTVGVSNRRYLSGTNDLGPTVLVGLSGVLSAGTYPVTVRHATDSGTLRTLNGTVIGIALSDDGGTSDAAIGGSQRTFTTQTGTSYMALTDVAWSENTMYVGENDQIIVAASFSIEHGTGAGPRTASYDITIASDPVSVTSEGEIDLSGSDDLSSGGLFGLSDPMTAGVHTGEVRHATDDGSAEILTGDLSFIELGVCCEGSPTAVRLKEFTATGYDSLVSVVWETGAEINTLGFYLLRADAPQGPFVKLNDEIIFARGSGAAGASYLFLDRLVRNGTVYYYRLEEVETNGLSTFYGPVEAMPYGAAGSFVYNPGDYAVVVENGSSPSPTPSSTPHAPSLTPTPIPNPEPSPDLSGFLIPIIDYGDYSGDGTSDIAIFRPPPFDGGPEDGLWCVKNVTRCYFGRAGDIPVSGDYDGDFTADIALFRPSSGLWAIRGLSQVYFGGVEDVAAPADYDGDGLTDIAVYRPDSGLWAVRGLTRIYFGRPTGRPVPGVYGGGGGTNDIPLPGDYDGDGTADLAVYRPDSGLWAVRELTRAYYGREGDHPVPADYDGDGTADIAVFRPQAGLWAIRDLTRIYFGRSSDRPVPGVYGGDGTSDIAIFRPDSGLWAVRDVTRGYFGRDGDIPVSR